MIARPLSRPRPIPFEAPTSKASATQPVSWANASGTAVPKPHTGTMAWPLSPPQAAQARPAPAHASAAHPWHGHAHPAHTAAHTPGAPAAEPVKAKFLGQGALSVRSSVTGRHYRFQGHGDCQAIDARDLLMLRRIQDLMVG